MREGDVIRSAVKGRGLASIQASTRHLSSRVHQLTGHCNVNLMHDSVRELASAVESEYSISETSVVRTGRRVVLLM